MVIRPKSSRFRGVYWDKKRGKWSASFRVPGYKRSWLGYHAVEEDAARAFDTELRRQNLPTARLNFPSESEATARAAAAVLPRRLRTSRFRGVFWDIQKGKWRASLRVPGDKLYHLGFHAIEEDAARARDAEVRRRNLPTAQLNFPAEGEATATEFAGLASSAAAAATLQQQQRPQQQQQRKRRRTPSPSPAPRSRRESSSPLPAPDRGGGGGALPVPEVGSLAPLTLEAIVELGNEPDPGARQASLLQAIGRLEVEARTISRKRGDAKRAAVAADASRDKAREIAKQKEAAVPGLLKEAEDAARMARGAAERAERQRTAAAGARRAADERAQLAARAQEDAERAERVYESAVEMHDRAFEAATRAKASLSSAAAEIERKKATVFGLLGVPGGT